MKRLAVNLLLLAALILMQMAPGWAQPPVDLAGQIDSGCALLEQGKVDEAQRLYEDLLKKHPDNPLILNNLGAIMVKKKNYQQALTYLNQAVSRAQGFRVTLDRVCSVENVCSAFRMSDNPLRGEDLEWLIKRNIIMVQMGLADQQQIK
jgi:tetratricopeptide (TPR) repeat protein